VEDAPPARVLKNASGASTDPSPACPAACPAPRCPVARRLWACPPPCGPKLPSGGGPKRSRRAGEQGLVIGDRRLEISEGLRHLVVGRGRSGQVSPWAGWLPPRPSVDGHPSPGRRRDRGLGFLRFSRGAGEQGLAIGDRRLEISEGLRHLVVGRDRSGQVLLWANLFRASARRWPGLSTDGEASPQFHGEKNCRGPSLP
jgi:hypothetical protein